MKRILAILSVIVLLGLLVLAVAYVVPQRTDRQAETFVQEAEDLISALQTYRDYVGSFPTGTHVDIAKALSGQGDSGTNVLVIAKSLKNRNNQGEMLDPWGTPLQIFFSHNAVAIRSAGPNKAFEDSLTLETDDLFCSDAK